MIWYSGGINAGLSIPVPSEQPRCHISHPEMQGDSGTISARSKAQSKAVALPSSGPSTPQGDKELTLTNAYRQMDIQLVNSFSTTVSVLKESMRLVTGTQCRAGKDLQIKITLPEKRADYMMIQHPGRGRTKRT